MKLPAGWRFVKGVIFRGSDRADLRATATHEAAHSVVAHLLGERVVRVELLDTWRGRSVSLPNGDVIVRAIAAMAGHEAEVRMCGRPAALLPIGDERAVIALGIRKVGFAVIRYMARLLVCEHERVIRRVAAALARRRALNRRQFLAVLREAS